VRLKTRIWLLLGGLLGVVLTIDLAVSYRTLLAESRAEMEYDARTLYGFMMATRRIYQQVFIASGLPVDDHTIGFLPAHSFSRISRDFATWNQSGVVFNNVSDRPRNPANRADAFEQRAMDWFRANPQARERMDEIVTPGGADYLLYTAPIRVEPFCLRCHGAREAAPPSIQARYADAYDYQVGELRGLVSIRIPGDQIQERMWRLWGGQLAKSLAGYAALFLALGLILDRLILGRLARLREGAQRMAAGDYAARIARAGDRDQGRDEGSDELGELADTFNRMADEVQSRDRDLGKLSQAVEQSPANIVITDRAARIEYANPATLRDTGYSRDELLGATPHILKSGRTPPETYQDLWATLTRGQVWEGEFINRRKDGSEYVEAAIVAPVRDAQGQVTHYLAVKQDITEKKRAEVEIHNLAFYDPLTNLPNRRLLMDRLGQALVASARTLYDTESTEFALVSEATPPAMTAKSTRKLIAALVAAFIIIVGFSGLLLAALLGTRVRSPAEFHIKSGALPLGIVPLTKDPNQPDAHFQDACRMLARALRRDVTKQGARVLVTGVAGREGVTTLVERVAAVAGLVQGPVLVVDVHGSAGSAPVLSTRLARHENEIQWSSLRATLEGFSEPEQAALPSRLPGVSLLSSDGRAFAASALGADGFGRVLDKLSKQYSLILLDAPPVLTSSITVYLAEWCDAALLVARAGHTRKADLAKARARLGTAGIEPVLGVLNAVEKIYDPTA